MSIASYFGLFIFLSITYHRSNLLFIIMNDPLAININIDIDVISSIIYIQT